MIADETYIDFADPAVRVDRRRDVLEGRPVIVIRSFSKILGLAGLRVGFAISDPEVARLLDLVQEPFNVNRAALAAGIAGVADPDFVERRRAEVVAAREVLVAELEAAGLATHPSQSNFVLVELGVDDVAVCEALKHRGILVRGGTEFGLPGIVRVTVAPEAVMRRAAAEIARVVTRSEGDRMTDATPGGIPDAVRARDLVGYGRNPPGISVARRRARRDQPRARLRGGLGVLGRVGRRPQRRLGRVRRSRRAAAAARPRHRGALRVRQPGGRLAARAHLRRGRACPSPSPPPPWRSS